MNTLDIKATNSTPSITFTPHNGTLNISGKSIPENPILIYQPVMNVINEYCKSPLDISQIILKLEYINTSSTKWLFYILEKFEQLYINKKKVDVSFYYNDESMLTTGQYLATNLALPIDLIKE